MKMTKIKTGAAVFAAGILLLGSTESLAAAQSAVYGFWKSFLPAMLPFFLLAPYLTGPDAQEVFSAVFGRVFPALFRVPGRGAGAVICGWIAGSPAGCAACAAAGEGMHAGEYARMCGLASGLSPAFLITAVGSGYLGDAQAGGMLFASHIGAVLMGGILLRKWEPGDVLPENRGEAARQDIFARAMANMGRVLCWMVVFSVLCALAEQRLGRWMPEWVFAPVCEISGGAAALAEAELSREVKMVLLSLCTGFGGVCVLMQNAQASGLRVRTLLGPKILHGALSAGLTALMLRAGEIPLPEIPGEADVFGAAVYAAVGLAALVATGGWVRRKNRVDGGLLRPYTDTKAQ
ncbi:MAG: hypothetical protein IJC54_08380 [Clostridia bacterium]|nr:hypothetical protein [Clostridia bacterium]